MKEKINKKSTVREKSSRILEEIEGDVCRFLRLGA